MGLTGMLHECCKGVPVVLLGFTGVLWGCDRGVAGYFLPDPVKLGLFFNHLRH